MGEKIKNVTPVGELHFVNITGKGKLNYNEDGYEYTATIHLTGEAAARECKKHDDILGEVPKGKSVKSTGYRELMEDEEGIYTPTANTTERDKKAKKTGIFAFTYKTNAVFPDGRPSKIAVYNSAAKKVDMGDRLIGNGSKGAISGSLERVERGKEVMVSCYLKAIQLVDFVEYSGDAGFEEQEGGFVAPEDDETGFSGTPEETPAKEATPAKPRL